MEATLLDLLLKIFSGGAGAAVGNLATFAGIVASITPAFLWISSDKGAQIFVQITYRDAAFWGLLFAANLFVAWLTRRGSTS